MVDTMSSYTVQKLAILAGVSVRTLHHYDEIGLLKPARVERNGYRFYTEPELLKLQQILFFRELDFPLSDIQRILSNPKFDMTKALEEQKSEIEKKKKRLTSLMMTIDKTIKKIKKEITMQDEELYNSFKEHEAKYEDEVKEKWGNTDAYKQSKERMAKMSKDDIINLKKGADIFMQEVVANMKFGPTSPEFQKLVDSSYNNLRTFYEPNLEMFRGLANMYVDDPRFTAYYEKYAPGLAVFMRDAMLFYCDQRSK